MKWNRFRFPTVFDARNSSLAKFLFCLDLCMLGGLITLLLTDRINEYRLHRSRPPVKIQRATAEEVILIDSAIKALYAPVAALAVARWFEKYSVFGHCDLRYTIGRYRRLAERSGLVPVGERNVTRQTAPTYDFIQQIASREIAVDWIARLARPLIGMQRMLGTLGLLNYYLLSFRKP